VAAMAAVGAMAAASVPYVPETDGPFWGKPDSAVTFCEKNYDVVFFIAEFMNSISSLIYVIFGIEGIIRSIHLNLNPSTIGCFVVLTVIGFGSTIFHATMRFWGELFDEIPMLLLCIAFLIAQTSTHYLLTSTTLGGMITYSLVVISIALGIYLYIQFHVYSIFLDLFTGITVFGILLGLSSLPNNYMARWYFWATVVSIVAGKIFWEIEQKLCYVSPYIIGNYFHVIWHILSCYAAYFWVLYTCCLQVEFGLMNRFKGMHPTDDANLEHRLRKVCSAFFFQPFNERGKSLL